MKKVLILAAGCGLLASVALAQTGAPSAQDFVTKVAISDMFEIQSSQLALSKQADTDTKPFAEKMVQDHQKTSTELKALVDGGKVKATLPSALDAEHQKMLDDLKAKSGKDFDQSSTSVGYLNKIDIGYLVPSVEGGSDLAQVVRRKEAR